MAATPTPTDTLIAQSKCIDSCIVGNNLKLAVLISIWARIANMSTNTDALIAGAACIQQCVPPGMFLPILISLADKIQQGGGAGTGTCLACGSGAPTIPATCTCSLYYDSDSGSPTAGKFWFWSNPDSAWIPFA